MDQVQVRLDVLDSEPIADHDLIIVIDNAPGGNSILPDGTSTDIAWDTLIYLPALGQISVMNSLNEPVAAQNVLSIRNPDDDTVEISLRAEDLQELHGRLSFQVFSSQTGSSNTADRMEPFILTGQAPAPAKSLLAFWNTLPAYSPAQALRRWDGAHTGPLGARHGLGNLLKAARDYQAPVALLDLKAIPSLAALDYLDHVGTVKDMADQGLLILPDTLPLVEGGPADDLPDVLIKSAAATSREVANKLGLPASQFVYGALSRESGDQYRFLFLPANPQEIFGPLGVSSNIYRYTGLAVLPISTGITTTQATLQGPALSIRRELVEEALRANKGQMDSIAILGGDLTRSTWGDPQYAAATLSWLKAHPWIELQDAGKLLAARHGQSMPQQLTPEKSQGIPEQLKQAFAWATQSHDLLANNAWQSFLAGYAPVAPGPPELSALRRVYLGQVNVLIEAARWAEDPQPIARCDVDPDLDLRPECILASQTQFTTFEIDSGALVYAFALQEGEVHQWVAPSSQFITGTSDPALWQMERGLAADPAVIPGAFSDAGPFQAQIQPGAITFTSQDLTKTFTLVEDGINVQYQSSNPQAAQIPLAIDPWLRFEADWEERYAGATAPNSLRWGIPGTFQVEVRSNASLSAQEFTASREDVRGSENPNIDYPAGHFVIFPLAVVDIVAPAGFEASLHFLP